MENLVSPSPSFWSGKRVFVTGHTGFKGTWLSLWLSLLGAEVHGFALAPEFSNSLFAATAVHDLLRHREGDIRDLSSVSEAMVHAQPEVVLHLAAQALVRKSYSEPIATYETNVIGTANVLEAARRIDGVKAVVIVTTDKCYRNREWDWPYREDDHLGGHDPYSASKACAEIVAASYRESFLGCRRVGLATARAGNVIGGGDWAPDRLIPDCIRAFQNSQSVGLRNVNSVRPWQHVLEPLLGYLLLAERLVQDPVRFSTAFNFGPAAEDAKPVSWVVDASAELWGDAASWTSASDNALHEARLLSLDSSRALRLIQWTPRLRIKAALRWTIEWYQSQFAASIPSRELVLEQIKRYSELNDVVHE